jgi:hypothetical protein
MPRPSKGPRLYLKRAAAYSGPRWTIRDGGREVGTGCGQSDLAGAEVALQRYIASKHDAAAAVRKRDPNEILIADAVSTYWSKHVNRPGKELARTKAIRARLANLLEESAFGLKTVGEVDADAQEAYVYERASKIAEEKDKEVHECQSAPRRELEDLSAAINFAMRQAGGASFIFRPSFPMTVCPACAG